MRTKNGRQIDSTATRGSSLRDLAGMSRSTLLQAGLAMRCRAGRGVAGVVLAVAGDGEPVVRARVPEARHGHAGLSGGGGVNGAGRADAERWLAVAAGYARRVATPGPSVVVPVDDGRPRLYGERPGRNVVVMGIGVEPPKVAPESLEGGEDGAPHMRAGLRGVDGEREATGGARLVEAFRVEAEDERDLGHRRQLLELSRALLDVQAAQSAALREAQRSHRLGQVLDGLDAFQGEGCFRGAAMALCNELSSRVGAERVSLGFLGGRYVKLEAMSQTEHLNRRMQLVQDIESAMEECLDQDVEVVHSADPPPELMPVVSWAAAHLSKKHGPSCVLTLPLRDGNGTPQSRTPMPARPVTAFRA